MNRLPFLFWLILGSGWIFLSCRETREEKKGRTPSLVRGVYHWKSAWNPGNWETRFLEQNQVNILYLKLFDVGFVGNRVEPIARTRFAEKLPNVQVVPVVFVENACLLDRDSAFADSLARRTARLALAMCQLAGIHPNEFQLDCDWGPRSREAYFHFIRTYRKHVGKAVSVTLRLYPFCYPQKTGIPPADRAMLMAYNANDLRSSSTRNSIFDPATVLAYCRKAKPYPLKLDLALPAFGWSVVFREGRYHRLVHELRKADLERNPRQFEAIGEGRFRLQADSTDPSGRFQFRRGDEFRTEEPSEENLLAIRKKIAENFLEDGARLVYFHLDSSALSRTFPSASFYAPLAP